MGTYATPEEITSTVQFAGKLFGEYGQHLLRREPPYSGNTYTGKLGKVTLGLIPEFARFDLCSIVYERPQEINPGHKSFAALDYYFHTFESGRASEAEMISLGEGGEADSTDVTDVVNDMMDFADGTESILPALYSLPVEQMMAEHMPDTSLTVISTETINALRKLVPLAVFL